jgi:putative intracellular protease/amidase
MAGGLLVVGAGRYDALVVVGGQGPMFTFEKAENIQAKFSQFHETGKPTAARCHGVATALIANAEEECSSGRVGHGHAPKDKHT